MKTRSTLLAPCGRLVVLSCALVLVLLSQPQNARASGRVTAGSLRLTVTGFEAGNPDLANVTAAYSATYINTNAPNDFYLDEQAAVIKFGRLNPGSAPLDNPSGHWQALFSAVDRQNVLYPETVDSNFLNIELGGNATKSGSASIQIPRYAWYRNSDGSPAWMETQFVYFVLEDRGYVLDNTGDGDELAAYKRINWVPNTPPTIAFTSPGASISTGAAPILQINGTAGDNSQVAKVEYQVEGTGGTVLQGWSAAEALSGTTSATWRVDLDKGVLALGSNTVRFRSTDDDGATGNTSWTFTYSQPLLQPANQSGPAASLALQSGVDPAGKTLVSEAFYASLASATVIEARLDILYDS